MDLEQGIPIPKKTRSAKYPFNRMEIGQSVFFAGETTDSKPYRAAKAFESRRGWKFVIRCTDGGLRIWRVE